MPSNRPGWSEPTLGFLVHDVARLLRKRLEQRARAAGIGLSRAQWRVLAYIARCEGMHQAALAAILDIEPITLVRLLDRLEAMGLVERRLDPRDRRQRNLFLTDRALPELERIRQLGTEVREEALAGLDEASRKRLLAELGSIKSNLQTALSGADSVDEGERRHG
jgi:DNA-binding MarR family transcriptional regulator